MDKKIEKQIINDVKVKVADFIYGCQNQSIGDGYRGLHVQSYVDLLWENMGLDKLQRKYIKPACIEMIEEGHLIAENEPGKPSSDEKSRISLTDEGIFYYFYKDKYDK